MVRYGLSLIIFLAGIVLTIYASGGNVWLYLDIPSLMMVGIFPFLFVSILDLFDNPGGFKKMALPFSIAFKKDTEKEELIEALHFFRVYGKTTWVAGLIAVLIGVIAMLANLEDRAALGPNLAVALISMLYSGIIQVVIITPFQICIKKRLKK
ncbi:MAG: MotA/TolQ/ExbB proton channel family protein [Treponema sp.]|jgi:flagellar motor component MotA|nr:MotA/TolQ/ExbB proton channel family protein [Treponema sp.]